MIAIRSGKNVFVAVLIFILIATVSFFYSAVAEESSFFVSRVGQMISNSLNAFSVDAPEEGSFSVTIHDDYHLYRVIETYVPAGVSTVEWDGCAYNSEKLNVQYYTFEFLLTGKSGNIYSYSFRSPVVDNAQFLQFVLPSSDTVYLSSADDWFLEAKSILNGTLVLDFYSFGSDQPVYSAQRTLHQGRVERFTFSELTGRSVPEAGFYAVSAYEISKPADTVDFPLMITDKPAPSSAVFLTGPVMPDDSFDDAEIWDLMMQPSVVVNIDYLDHQNVFSDPDQSGKIIGTLHGQTQCLCVIEIADEWAKIGAWQHEDASYVEGWVPLKNLKTVYPNSEYGLLLDKRKQTLTVFRNGVRIESLLVSTGRMEKGKYEQETSAGSFLTGLHRVDFSMEGNRYDFVIQYDGGNLLHQIPYTSDGKKDFTIGRAYLGSKASHACIRIQDSPGPISGINAYWVWTHIPYHTRLIILDDPEAREETVKLLSGNTPTYNEHDLLQAEETRLQSEQAVTMTFAGDFIPSSREESQWQVNSFSPYFEQYGSVYPFGNLFTYFETDDLTSISLDCVLRNDYSGRDYDRRFIYRGVPEFADIFPGSSVELVCLENEHIYDFGEDGKQDTIHALEEKTSCVACNQSLCITIKGHMFGICACSENRYMADPFCIQNDIRELRNLGCEYVIVQCHWAEGIASQHGSMQEAMARACERYGADLVIGSGPDCAQGIGYVNRMPVVWSLGKLLSDKGKERDAILVQVHFSFEDQIQGIYLEIVPVLAGFYTQKDTDLNRPSIAGGEDRIRILTSVQNDSVISISDLTCQQ